MLSKEACFNPRTHTGCDLLISGRSSLHRFVSIHAPTRGATLYGARVVSLQYVSIHAPTRGATVAAPVNPIRKRSCFNPRTHTGCDLISASVISGGLVSIHAPTRGATGHDRDVQSLFGVSIHAPTRGATVCKVTYYKSIN